jgi:hypothetical protein
MTEKQLLQQLHNLKSIRSNAEWKASNREVLLSQINNGTLFDVNYGEENKSWWKSLENAFHIASQPSWVAIMILFALLGTTGVSWAAGRKAKPGDSLYIARIISDKARLAVTFNEEKKAELTVQLAGNRAKDIAGVIASTENKDNTPAESKVNDKLKEDFKKEIATIKTNLPKIAKKENTVSQDNANNGIINNVKNKAVDKTSPAKDTGEVFSANSQKSNKGIDIYIKPEVKATTTPATTTESFPSFSKEGLGVVDPQKVLDEAQKLFDKGDYTGAADKLNEVNNTDVATSTESVK